MLRLSGNPPSRFPERTISDATGPWWLAKVKPRQEKALAFDFIEHEIEYYLPMYLKVTRRKDNNKPRKSILCLFEGYISFCSPRGFERKVFATNRVVNIIEIQHQSRFISQLEQIYHLIDLGTPLVPLSTAEYLIPGTPVKVEYGPLREVVGTVIKYQNSHKLILSVDGLGKAALKVPADSVKPI